MRPERLGEPSRADLERQIRAAEMMMHEARQRVIKSFAYELDMGFLFPYARLKLEKDRQYQRAAAIRDYAQRRLAEVAP